MLSITYLVRAHNKAYLHMEFTRYDQRQHELNCYWKHIHSTLNTQQKFDQSHFYNTHSI